VSTRPDSIDRSGGLRLAAFFFMGAALSGLACRRGTPSITVESRSAGEPDAGTGSGRAASNGAKDGSGVSRAEMRSIDLFLAKNPNLRLATDADAHASDDSAEVSHLYGVYHPFFVRGDVNDDGAIDFAAAFVDRARTGASPWFTIAIFCSDRSGGFREPEILEREISLERGDISIDRDCVIITPDLGEDANRRYRWNELRRRFEFVSDDDEAADPRPINRI
jgi:hypothetical protein